MDVEKLKGLVLRRLKTLELQALLNEQEQNNSSLLPSHKHHKPPKQEDTLYNQYLEEKRKEMGVDTVVVDDGDNFLEDSEPNTVISSQTHQNTKVCKDVEKQDDDDKKVACAKCGKLYTFENEFKCSFCHSFLTHQLEQIDSEIAAVLQGIPEWIHQAKQEAIVEFSSTDTFRTRRIQQLDHSYQRKEQEDKESGFDLDILLNGLKQSHEPLKLAEKQHEYNSDVCKTHRSLYDKALKRFHKRVDKEKDRLYKRLAAEAKDMPEMTSYTTEENDGMLMVDVELDNGDKYGFYWDNHKLCCDDNPNGKWKYYLYDFFETGGQLNEIIYKSTYHTHHSFD